MDAEGIRAAKAYVDVVDRHAKFSDECKEMENRFKSEASSAKMVLSDFTNLTPAARLPDGRLVRSVCTESVLSITESRLRGAFAGVDETKVIEHGGVLQALLSELRNRCISIKESVKITKDTKGLPPTAFPIPAAPKPIQETCANLDSAEQGLKAVRKHKRVSKRDTEVVKEDLSKKVETAYVTRKRPATEDTPPPPPPSEDTPPPPPPSEDTPPSEDDDASVMEDDEESEEELAMERAATPPLIITKPPTVTLPGDVEATPLPQRPVHDERGVAAAIAFGNKEIVESDIVESDIRVRMVETTRRGRSPTIKQFASTLDGLLRRVRTYKQFNDKREELTERAVEMYNEYRDRDTKTNKKLKIDKPKKK